jgi:hypothetical protein
MEVHLLMLEICILVSFNYSIPTHLLGIFIHQPSFHLFIFNSSMSFMKGLQKSRNKIQIQIQY